MSEVETARTPAAQRLAILAGMSASVAGAALIWWAVLRWHPQPGIEGGALALALIGAATLFTLLPGIEAIAHERLFTPAIDPLAGAESARMRVNQRYLSNTLEQLIVFAAGLALLARYAEPRVLIAATLVWVIGRWAFWAGYHVAPRFRAIGLVGMAQSLVILAYAVGRGADEAIGPGLFWVVIGLFGAIEVVLTVLVTRPSR